MNGGALGVDLQKLPLFFSASKKGYVQQLYPIRGPDREKGLLELLDAKQRHSGKRTWPELERSRAETPYRASMQLKCGVATETGVVCSQGIAQLLKEEKAPKVVHKGLYKRGIREYVARSEEATAAMEKAWHLRVLGVPRRAGRVTGRLMIVLDVAYLASLGAYFVAEACSAAFEAEQSSGLSFQVPA